MKLFKKENFPLCSNIIENRKGLTFSHKIFYKVEKRGRPAKRRVGVIKL